MLAATTLPAQSANWVNQTGVTAAPFPEDGAIAFDESRDRVVLFGGFETGQTATALDS